MVLLVLWLERWARVGHSATDEQAFEEESKGIHIVV